MWLTKEKLMAEFNYACTLVMNQHDIVLQNYRHRNMRNVWQLGDSVGLVKIGKYRTCNMISRHCFTYMIPVFNLGNVGARVKSSVCFFITDAEYADLEQRVYDAYDHYHKILI